MRLIHALCPIFVAALAATSFTAKADIAGFPPQSQSADMVLTDANIATLDPLQPKVEALAIRDHRVQALGSNKEISAYIDKRTKVVDLHGAFVTPGFIEGHGHLMETGQSLMQINVGKAKNWQGIVDMIDDAVADAKPGQWIVGAGWQENKWNKVPQPNIQGLPLPEKLNAVSPDNPVMLITAARHGVYANAAALKAAHIGENTPDPEGGTIVRDQGGRAIGMLRDTAAKPVYSAYHRHLNRLSPEQRKARRQKILKLAVDNEIRKGITTFVDQGEDFETIDWLKKQADQGLPLRLYVNVGVTDVDKLDKHLAEYRTVGYANDHFTVRGVGEDVSDGALGTHSAWFLEPYADAPQLTGKNVTSTKKLEKILEIAARDGFQASIHAIGDRANREMLDIYQKIFEKYPGAHRLRWRIEHAQHLSSSDIPRFAKLGVIPSMQSIHTCSDAPMVIPRIGKKRAKEGAYVWKKLIQSGAIVLDGTDTPVEDTNPIPVFYCGVTRAYDHGKKTFFPNEAKTRLQELRSYTWNNAYAIFEESQLGSLTPGKLADIDVFSGDLLSMPQNQILRTRVLYTIIGGKIVYKRKAAENWRKGDMFPAMPEFNHAE